MSYQVLWDLPCPPSNLTVCPQLLIQGPSAFLDCQVSQPDIAQALLSACYLLSHSLLCLVNPWSFFFLILFLNLTSSQNPSFPHPQMRSCPFWEAVLPEPLGLLGVSLNGSRLQGADHSFIQTVSQDCVCSWLSRRGEEVCRPSRQTAGLLTACYKKCWAFNHGLLSCGTNLLGAWHPSGPTTTSWDSGAIQLYWNSCFLMCLEK